MTRQSRPLIVRLRNWVGDVTLGVPTLRRLADAGYTLQLVGKGWAQDLLAGHGWPVHVLPKTWRERVRLLRRLGAEAAAADTGFRRRINAVCFPYSFSSALEFRAAGLRAIGHAYEGRGWLLARSVRRPLGRHELEVYWDLGNALLGSAAAAPPAIALAVGAPQRQAAEALLERHRVRPGYVVICPFAGGTWSGADKTWPAFAAFAAELGPRFARDVLICPGPGEEGVAARDYPRAICLPNVPLGSYAALLQRAALMVSNDTGPGHIAAAVGAPLLSVLGPSDPAQWGAWGPTVHFVRGAGGSWPAPEQVAEAAAAALR
jgi:heptosyltransferase II